MKIRKSVLEETSKIVEVVCNKCGKHFSCKSNSFETNLIHDFVAKFGYSSEHDFEKLEFDLCEDCLNQFINTFEIEPTKGYYGVLQT